jgi:replicative DNA helicase
MDNNLKLPEHLFEPLILKYSVYNRAFFLKVKQYLDTSREMDKSYFYDEKVQRIFNLISRFFDKFQDLPKKDTLKSLIKKSTKDEEIKLLSESLVDKMYDNNLDDIDERYFEEEVLNFIKEAKLYEAIAQSQGDMQEKNFGPILKRIESAVQINFDKDLGVSIKDTEIALEKIKELDNVKTIETGWTHLDSFLDGGLHPKEIICLAATPGGGKCERHDVKITIKYKIKDGKIL